ncbi:MAG: hypothetical protein S0880_36250 [Actinomycetota bacterium]|nr:hypothetical protein [Actinomycetota bacterium]
MSLISDRPSTTTAPDRRRAAIGKLLYRFEGQLGELYPIGLFPDGIHFHNEFEGRVVDGPFAGARIFGLDQFVQRPDGIGIIVAPEVIDDGTHRVALELRGYVVPPAGLPVPPLEVMLEPDFAFPDLDFRVTGVATAATASPELAHLNSSIVVVEGKVNLSTGALDVSAYLVDAIG